MRSVCSTIRFFFFFVNTFILIEITKIFVAISTFPGLEGLVGEIEGQIEITKNEREELGLVMPQNYDVSIYFSSPDNYAAGAWPYIDGRAMVGVYLLNSVLNFFNTEKRQELQTVQKYYHVLFSIFGDVNELKIHDIFNQGKEEIAIFEQQFQGTRSFHAFKEQYQRQHKRSYDKDVLYLLENAPFVQETLHQLLPYMISLYPRTGTKYIRHEFDHLDFFQSKLWERQTKQQALLSTLAKLYKEDPKKTKEGYARANLHFLEMQCYLKPILEGRALFFDFIEPNEWYCADFFAAAQNVKKRLQWYINTIFPQYILNNLLISAEMKQPVSDDTKQYIHHQHYTKIRSRRARFHTFQEENVDKNLAQHILGKEMSQWKRRFMETTHFTVPALQTAYQEDASRVLVANTAKDYPSFIHACYGR